jgi:hypothetical protein
MLPLTIYALALHEQLLRCVGLALFILVWMAFVGGVASNSIHLIADQYRTAI